MYLEQFTFPGKEEEYTVLMREKRTCYNTVYPFRILSEHQLECLVFEPVTILYGGNGSGKSTALNVIAEKLGLERDSVYNRSGYFETYTGMCRYESSRPIPKGSRIITSDDVFAYMLDIRKINLGIDRKREELFEEYLDAKYASFRMRSLDDYEQLKKVTAARRQSQSQYARQNVMENIREQSNGESAFFYFTNKIQEDGLYLLDEPENSLSPDRQQELAEFLQNSARFFGCQLVIATHSPFLLSIKGARIYDLDENPADIKKWTELENVQAYYRFFEKHREEFF